MQLQLTPGAAVMRLHCENLFDGRTLAHDVCVSVANGVVSAIEPYGTMDAIRDDTVRVPFLMPGLIDSHVHATGYVEGLPAGAPFEPMKHFMRLCASNGVTTIRDTGNSLETLFYLREWGERFDGPRIVGSGPLLDDPPFTWMFSRIVRDEQTARRTVEVLADEGVDFVKAYRNITPEILRVIVDAAGSRDLYVAVDSERTSALDAIEIGVGSVEHSSNLLDDRMLINPPPAGEGMVASAKRWAFVDLESEHVKRLTEAFLEHETFLVPTLLVSRRWALLDEMVNDPHGDDLTPVMPYHRWFKGMRSPIGQRIGRRYLSKYMPVEGLSRRERDEVERGLANMGELTVRLMNSGVRVAMGTDTPNPSIAPGFALLDELVQIVACGVDPISALRSATSSAAALIPSHKVGVIEPGACADFCVFDGRPDVDISDIHNITYVVKGGKVLDIEAMKARVREAARAISERE